VSFNYNLSKNGVLSPALISPDRGRFHGPEAIPAGQWLAMKPLKFITVLRKLPGHGSSWHFIHIDAAVGKQFEKKNGTRRVVCTINGRETFHCALIPSKGEFIIVVNKAKRTKLKIEAGDNISVELKPDNSKYGLPMPEEFEEVLRQDRDGDKLFHALTPGKQRSLIYLVSNVKDIDRRIHTALTLVEHLKRNQGQINGSELHNELKRPGSTGGDMFYL
jgi:hypothetical protein